LTTAALDGHKGKGDTTLMNPPKKVAGVVTVYNRWSHADVILTKLLEGYLLDGKTFPSIRLAALYVDQFPENDVSRDLAKKHDFPIYPTIEGALTLGGKEIAVDGVLVVAEHGKYPTNARGQILYPKRRFFEEVAAAFVKYKKAVPVFNDKHLGPTWADAKWMYDKTRELFAPLLAGSSIPLTWRRPALTLPIGCELSGVVVLGYGPFEGYGFHALEGLQCMVERRKDAEIGVKAVQCLQGPAMWEALDKGVFSKESLDAALALVPAHASGDYREITSKTADAGVMLVEYLDGFNAAVVVPNGWIYEGEGAPFIFAGKLKGRDKPVATQFYLQQPDPFGHFAYLVKAIESMVQTGHAPYPAERTLLTSAVLDAVMTSKAEKNRRVETPHLAIRYRPVDWPFATDPIPKAIKR
jgi:hypothetical protein